ncbi:unnamed protein product [Sphagnum troendelagicum]|uniref:rRNA-processing protein EFG1 n=1 Tax=Sphagnum troendelagicum TaxID=128251 RepID=A0ABP0UH28_9BRYO
MAHGGYGKKKKAGKAQLTGRREGGGAPGVLRKGADKQENKKTKVVSIKNQIRGIERLLKKVLPAEVKDAQQKKLEELKQQSDVHFRIELERKMALRYRKVKFFERRKIERRIRRLEKQQRTSDDNPQRLADIAEQLTQLKEDLEYVRFFPKTEKYISLFMGSEDEQVVTKRNVLRDRIKANLLAAAATGVDLEETGSEDEAVDMSEDDFFMAGSSSDDVDADDEWTDKSPRGRGSTSNATVGNKLRSSSSSHMQMGKRARYSQLSSSTSEEHVRAQTRGSSSSTIFENVKTTTLDIQRSKPKRKRRPKKKKTT